MLGAYRKEAKRFVPLNEVLIRVNCEKELKKSTGEQKMSN
jgi:hypothetical protein